MLFGKRKRIVNRILIVEDEPLTAFDNEVMLGDLGYEVVATLDSFEDAIAAAGQRGDRPDPQRLSPFERTERPGSGARGEGTRRFRSSSRPAIELPPESAQLALGCITKPYSERTLKLALEAVDKRLAGKKREAAQGRRAVHPRRGLEQLREALVEGRRCRLPARPP